MAKNYMADVAKILGVELEEEFKAKIIGIDKPVPHLYKINNNGLCYKSSNDGYWEVDCSSLTSLLNGEAEIIKLPWKPKAGEHYWYVGWRMYVGKGQIGAYEAVADDLYTYSNMAVDIGNYFKTREEAEAQKYEVFKRLTGKDWHETYGKR